MTIYKCPICGNIIYLAHGNKDLIKCCGVDMEEIIPNTVEAAVEKHIPVYEIEGDNIKVTIGEVVHPMLEEHYIMFIAQVYDNEVHIVNLKPGMSPVSTFKYVKGSKLYAYCNIHGLWVKEVD